jgi:hypothetical protein
LRRRSAGRADAAEAAGGLPAHALGGVRAQSVPSAGSSGRRGRCRQALSSFERALIFCMVPAPRTVEQRGGCCGWQATELGWRA